MSSPADQHLIFFDEALKRWGFELPKETVRRLRRGIIIRKGWLVWYLFDVDEAGEHLDCYQWHRMADDDHFRLYADGSSKQLSRYRWWHVVPDDPEEKRRIEEEHREHNELVSRELEAKGFGHAGDKNLGKLIALQQEFSHHSDKVSKRELKAKGFGWLGDKNLEKLIVRYRELFSHQDKGSKRVGGIGISFGMILDTAEGVFLEP